MNLKIYFSSIFILMYFLSLGQEISRSSIMTTGSSLKNEEGSSLDWMMNEIIYINIPSPTTTNDRSQQIVDNNKEAILIEDITYKLHTNSTEEEDINHLEFSFFPNPTYDKLLLKCGEINASSIQTKLYNKKGQLLFSQNLDLHAGQTVEINHMSKLPSGVYTIIIQTENNILFKELIVKI